MGVKQLLRSGYAVAIGATVSAAVVAMVLKPILSSPPLSLFLIAVMLAAWYGGVRAGLTATALSVATSFALLAFPVATIDFPNRAISIELVLLSAVGALMSFGISHQRKAEQRAFKAILERQPLETSLLEHDQILHLSPEIIPVASFEADLTAHACYRVSPQWYQIYGIAPGAFKHSFESWLKLAHPDDRKVLKSGIAAAFERRASDFSAEFRITRRNDRAVRWIELRAAIRYDQEGRPVHIVGSNIDITERKRTEQSAAASKRRFKLLAEASARLLATDEPQKVIEDLCHAVMAELGCDCFFNTLLDDSEGRFCLNASAGLSADEIRDIQQLGCCATDRCPITVHGEPFLYAGAPCTSRVRSFGIQTHACHPLLVQGRIIGSLSFGTRTRPSFTVEEFDLMKSVTNQVATAMQRVLDQRLLRESEAHFRTIVQAVPSLILESDAEGNNTFASERWCAYTGLSPEESAGQGWLSALHPDDLAKAKARWSKAAQAGAPFESQYRLRSRDGSYHWFIARALPSRDADGKIVRWTGSLTDTDDLVRTEDALRASEAQALAANRQMRAIMQTARVAICVAHDPECRLVTGNAQAHQLLGLPEGSNLSATSNPNGVAPYRFFKNGREVPYQELPMRRVLKFGEIVEDMELEIVRADGTRRYVLSTAAPLHDNSGRVRGATATFLDITERKQIEIEHQKFVSLAAQSSEFIGMCGPDFHTFYVNDAGLRLVGLDNLEQARRTSVKEFLFPEDQNFAYEKLFPRVLREGRAKVEIRFRHFKTGATLWMLSNVFVIRDANGEPAGFATVGHDITERKQAQQALAAVNDRLAADLEAMTKLRAIGALFVQEDGLPSALDQIVETAIAITGADRGQIHLVDTVSGSLRTAAQRGLGPDFLEFWQSARSGPGPWDAAAEEGKRVIVEDVTRSYLFKDEQKLRAMLAAGVRAVHCTPLLCRGGQPLGILSTYYETPHWPDERAFRLLDLLARQTADIIERARTEARLKEADLRKNEFIAMLGHELRNPLAPIRNAAHLIRKLAPPNPKMQWAQDVINRQVDHLARLVDDLLDVSRIVQGKLKLQKTLVNLTALLQQTAEAAKPQIDARGHCFTVNLPNHPLYCQADPVRLTQMIANLLDNANKYTPRGGTIRFDADYTGNKVMISVRDNGEGIPGALLPHLFDVFTQSERTLDRAQGGLGLGLTIVRKIAELHGGCVKVKSDGPGKGAEFIVRLPLDDGKVEIDASARTVLP